MDPILLSCILADGSTLSATFEADKGMNLASFKHNEKELIHNQNGFLIGPHFGNRKPHMYPGKDEEPFPNGISRQAPWKADVKDNTLTAVLDSKEVWNEQPLTTQEGQGFKQTFQAKLTPEGLHILLSVVSDTDSLVGIDCAWELPEGKSTLKAAVGSHLLAGRERHATEKYFQRSNSHEIEIPLHEITGDFTFYPSPPVKGNIRLHSDEKALQISYSCICQENCWRLVKDKNSRLVRIQPLSAQNPFTPNLSVSTLAITISPL